MHLLREYLFFWGLRELTFAYGDLAISCAEYITSLAPLIRRGGAFILHCLRLILCFYGFCALIQTKLSRK
jgi:hypothetical protein